MLGAVDLSRKISKEDYRARKDELENCLAALQQQIIQADLPIVVCVDGWAASGKGSTISKLVTCLDPRTFSVYPMNEPDREGRRFPYMMRFWQRIGRYGTMTIFDKSWYREIFQTLFRHVGDKGSAKTKKQGSVSCDDRRLRGDSKVDELEAYAMSALALERQLRDDGYLVVKCFLHVSKREQGRRLDALMADENTSWRVTEDDREQNRSYDRLYPIIDRVLERTDEQDNPWHVIPAEDKRVCLISLMEVLIARIKEALDERGQRSASSDKDLLDTADDLVSHFTLVVAPRIEDIRHDLVLEDAEYSRRLKEQQAILSANQLKLYRENISLVIVYEGWDAAGKGGSIRRVAAALDARDYRVIPSSAPNEEERQHPFLWRYWMNLPKSGHIAIYDRSWYGRVLVERVEGLATRGRWRRAYEEINEFEWELHQSGAILVKLWIEVGPEEQLRRFRERENDPTKRWKITEEDWRNRRNYPLYKVAANDMFRLTSTMHAPWTIVESDDKHHARVKALETVNAAVARRL